MLLKFCRNLQVYIDSCLICTICSSFQLYLYNHDLPLEFTVETYNTDPRHEDDDTEDNIDTLPRANKRFKGIYM